MTQQDLHELLVEQIRDLYDAEKQLVKALPKLAKASASEELADALRRHLEETQTHVSRLEEVFGLLEVAHKGKPCKAMKGLIEEGNEAVQEGEKGPMRDLAIIAGCQRVEHYEISAYGTVRTLAEHLELEGAVELLQHTQDEEEQADEKLTEVASSLYEGAETEADEEEPGETEETETAGSGRGATGSSTKPATRKAGS